MGKREVGEEGESGSVRRCAVGEAGGEGSVSLVPMTSLCSLMTSFSFRTCASVAGSSEVLHLLKTETKEDKKISPNFADCKTTNLGGKILSWGERCGKRWKVTVRGRRLSLGGTGCHSKLRNKHHDNEAHRDVREVTHFLGFLAISNRFPAAVQTPPL